MKKKLISSILSLLIIIFIMFPSVTGNNIDLKNNIRFNQILNNKNIEPVPWFPGFFIYQLFRGIIAFILILLILLDITTPEYF